METAAAHTDLTGIALVALAALVCGLGLERLRQPAIVGYIVAGVLLGPSGFALVENRAQIDGLAELGVLMLLFVVGMELSLRSFRRLWRLAVLATLFQIGVSTGLMVLLSMAFHWPLGLAVLLGFVVALSSTAVAIKVLEDLGELRTRAGRITVSVLIAQDLAVVPMMLGLAILAESDPDWVMAAKIVVSMALLGWLIWFLSRGRKVTLPMAAAVDGHADLTPLTGLAFCFGAAALSGLFGLSAAYGAFLAGLVIGNSHQRHSMLAAIRPIQSVLMMAFFLSIGLLVDLDYVWAHLGVVVMFLFLVTVFKTTVNVGIIRLLGQSWERAFLAGVMLAQIGEFSFLLAVVGARNGLIGAEDTRLVVAVTVLSLALSPLWVISARRLRDSAEAGISTIGDLLHTVYGREAEMVADAWDEARLIGKVTARKVGDVVEGVRVKQKDTPAETAETEPVAPVEAGPPAPEAEPPAPAAEPEKPPRDGTDDRFGYA